jgi:hypothetical protein
VKLLDRINQFITLFLDTLRQITNWRIWLPLLGLFAVYWLILYAHRDYVSPVFYSALGPWLRLLGDNQAIAFGHYPQQFLILPSAFGWAKLVVGLVLEGLLLGLVARLFARAYGMVAMPGTQVRPFGSLWLHLVVVWVILNGVTVLVGYVLPAIAGPYINGPRRLVAFGFVIMPFVFTLIFSLLLFAIPAVAAYGETSFRAIARSLRIFLRRPFTCFFLSMIVLAVPLLIAAITNLPVALIDRFRPELIYWLLLISLAAETVANFFWMGTTIRFLAEPEE